MSKYEKFENDDEEAEATAPVTESREEMEVISDRIIEPSRQSSVSSELILENIDSVGELNLAGDFQIENGNRPRGVSFDVSNKPTQNRALLHRLSKISNVPHLSANQFEVLSRASIFFQNENVNFMTETIDDPASSVLAMGPWKEFQANLRSVVEHLYFRLFMLFLIFVDLVLVMLIICVESQESTKINYTAAVYTDFTLTCLFVVEVCFRIAAIGFNEFFHYVYRIVDLIVVVVSFLLSVGLLVFEEFIAPSIKIVVLLRLVRFIPVVRILTERKNVERGARELVSQNKRRFRKDGFDLDLTYVTERVIAMSFPSSGHRSFYRNPISEVKKFFDTKHTDHYKVYNLCSERSYDPTIFHGRVERYMIDDHNVPSAKDMIRFAESVRNWLKAHPENVIAVHCKGGKGRTGTMICLWLVEAGIFSTALASLDYFGGRRTDLKVGSAFQGVETPSQVDGQYADEKLRDELRRTKDELEDLKQLLQEGGSEFAEKEKELAELYKTLNEKNQQILEVEEELVTKSSNLDAALSEIKEHVAQREELENLVEELNKKVKEVQDLRANEQLDYTRSHEELQSEKRRLLCEKDNLKAELDTLQAKLNEAYSDADNLEKIYRSTKSTWETEKLELKAKMDADIQNKDALLSATVKDLEDERLKIVSLNEALQLLAQEKGALCKDLEEEKKNNSSAFATIQTLTDERNLGLKENEELKEKLCSAENLVKTLQSKFEDKNVDGTKKNEEIKTLEKEVKNLNKKIVELQTENGEKDAKVQKNTEELNQLRFLAKDYEVLQLKIKAEGHSSEATKEVKQDYDRLWGAYEEAQQEIEGLKNGLADKQKELQQFQKNRELGFHHSEAKVKQLTEELQREKREVQKLCEMMSSMTPSKKQEVLEMENCRLKEEAVKLKEENDRLKKDCDKKRHNSNDERRTTLHPAFMPEKEFRKPRQRSKPVAEETDSEKKTTRPRTRRPKPVKYLESDSNDENLDTSNHSNAPLTRSALKKGISTVKISLKEADAATNVKDEDESDFITSEEDKSRRNTRRPLFKPQKSEFDDFDSLVAPKASSGRSTRNHKRL